MKPINPNDMNYPQWLTDPDSDMECPEEDREYHKVTSMGMEWEVVVHPGTWKGTYVAFCQRLDDAWVVEDRKEDCLERIGGVIEGDCVAMGRLGELFEYLYEDNGFSFDEFVKIDRVVRRQVKKDLFNDFDEINRLRKLVDSMKRADKKPKKRLVKNIVPGKHAAPRNPSKIAADSYARKSAQSA